MDWHKSKGKMWNGRWIPRREMAPAKPYKGECHDCGDPAPIGLYQCDDCQMLAREQQKEFDRNQTFLDMQRGPNPLTNAEIEKLATKDPDRGGKFRGMGKGGE